jgi:hypothetical protein
MQCLSLFNVKKVDVQEVEKINPEMQELPRKTNATLVSVVRGLLN